MIPPTFILSSDPVPGRTYHPRAIIGEFPHATLIYRGMVHREKSVSYIAKGGKRRSFYYQYNLGQFLDPGSGELVEMEIEVNQA